MMGLKKLMIMVSWRLLYLKISLKLTRKFRLGKVQKSQRILPSKYGTDEITQTLIVSKDNFIIKQDINHNNNVIFILDNRRIDIYVIFILEYLA